MSVWVKQETKYLEYSCVNGGKDPGTPGKKGKHTEQAALLTSLETHEEGTLPQVWPEND